MCFYYNSWTELVFEPNTQLKSASQVELSTLLGILQLLSGGQDPEQTGLTRPIRPEEANHALAKLKGKFLMAVKSP